MGGIGGFSAFSRAALAAGATGVAAAGLSSALTVDESRARAAWLEEQDVSDPLPAATHADGLVRLGLLAGGLLAGAAGGAAALLRRPSLAAGALGAATGATAAALLTPGHGGGNVVEDAVDAIRRGISKVVRDQVHSSNPTIPDPRPAGGATRARPGAEQLERASLDLLPGTADLAEARRLAEAALREVDWSRRDIVAWLPGTNEHYVPSQLRAGIERVPGADVSTVLLDYPANVDFHRSAATGMEALRIFLAEVARRGGDHRVLLAGHSQGAWVIRDAMADPVVDAAVDRALLFGTFSMARSERRPEGDPRVLEVIDRGDVLTRPIAHDDALAEQLGAIHRGETPNYAVLAALVVANPGFALYNLGKWADPAQWRDDPHRYEPLMGDGAAWLLADG